VRVLNFARATFEFFANPKTFHGLAFGFAMGTVPTDNLECNGHFGLRQVVLEIF
jgi:hypothetical protein